MSKPRKLFCERNPLFFEISQKKGILQRHLQDCLRGGKLAKTRGPEELPYEVGSRETHLIKRAPGVDLRLQENKAVNIRLACEKLDGLLIRPGETFSFWRTIGKTTKRKGYLDGRVIEHGKLVPGTGGGLCNLGNTLHLLILHSPLTVTEFHHHSDALAPDEGPRVPFSAGTSVCYNYIDYRFRNDTRNTYQLRLWTDDEYLCGELRATEQQPHTFHIHAENEFFSREGGVVYRNGEVYRDIIDRASGQRLDSQLIRTNHARVMYDCPPSMVIREENG